VDAFCNEASVSRNVSCTTSQLSTLYNLVALGMGLSLVPEMFVKKAPSGPCVIKNFTGKVPKRTISMYWHSARVRNPLGEFLSDIIKSQHR
jgi:DNA-binding transcriptional LysR family regulator